MVPDDAIFFGFVVERVGDFGEIDGGGFDVRLFGIGDIGWFFGFGFLSRSFGLDGFCVLVIPKEFEKCGLNCGCCGSIAMRVEVLGHELTHLASAFG